VNVVSLLQRHLAQAAYEGVTFPVESSSLQGGHDSVKHTAWRVRGADVEHTGQRPYTGKLRIPFVEGLAGWADLFPGRFAELVGAFERSPQGTLVHPTRGTISVQIDDWSEDLEVRMSNGCILEMSFTELRGEAELLFHAGEAAAPEQVAIEKADKADREIAEAQPDPAKRPTPVAPAVKETIAFLTSNPRSYVETRTRMDALLDLVGIVLRAPLLLSIEMFGAREALLLLRAALFQLNSSLLGSAQTRQVRLPVAMSVSQAAALPEAFGDARRANEILQSNAIADPLRIPAGTLLTLLDR
jgi:prophage DNA circulation protein